MLRAETPLPARGRSRTLPSRCTVLRVMLEGGSATRTTTRASEWTRFKGRRTNVISNRLRRKPPRIGDFG
jgi:hypothetical protein